MVSRGTHPVRWRLPIFGVALVALVALAFVSFGGSSDNGHRLVILSPTATFIFPGLEVRDAGQPIGTVVSAHPTRAGTARVVIQINKAGLWPLPAGTTAQFRMAGTIAATNRYVQLTLPRHESGTLADDAVIRGDDVTQAVEFDQIFDIFNGATRTQLKSLLNRGGPALSAAKPGLEKTLSNTPAALDQVEDVFSQLGSDPAQLSLLVNSTTQVVSQIQTADPTLDQLISGAATTLNATATQSTDLGRTLVELPGTLTTLDHTLAHADGTLDTTNTVLTRLGPGLAGVKRLAPRLDDLLQKLRTVSPNGTAALVDLTSAVPDVNGLLNRADSLMPNLQTIGTLGTTELNCIRPYAPETTGFATVWDSFIDRADGEDKYARINAGVYPYADSDNPLTPADVIKLDPALHYVNPAPPGEVAGQPWYNAACGVGTDSTNASDAIEGGS